MAVGPHCLPVVARGSEIGRFLLEPATGVAVADQVGAALAVYPPA